MENYYFNKIYSLDLDNESVRISNKVSEFFFRYYLHSFNSLISETL